MLSVLTTIKKRKEKKRKNSDEENWVKGESFEQVLNSQEVI